jgi:hypothetical protein
MKYLLSLLLFISTSAVFAQANKEIVVEKTIEVGQKLKIKSCKLGQTEFIAIDIYARTKPYESKTINKATGEGLMEAFFSDKSIDAKRLPCVMSNQSYTIAAYHEFEVEKELKRVVLCYTTYPLTLIWIELDKALELGEIDFE